MLRKRPWFGESRSNVWRRVCDSRPSQGRACIVCYVVQLHKIPAMQSHEWHPEPITDDGAAGQYTCGRCDACVYLNAHERYLAIPCRPDLDVHEQLQHIRLNATLVVQCPCDYCGQGFPVDALRGTCRESDGQVTFMLACEKCALSVQNVQ